MGCGSSRSLRAVTPIQSNGKEMVRPLAWSNARGQHKKSLLLNETSFRLENNAGVQTDQDVPTFDVPVQTDKATIAAMSWNGMDAGTQTPIDDGTDELERILNKAYKLDNRRNSIDELIAKAVFSEASVQTVWSHSDSSSQTDIDFSVLFNIKEQYSGLSPKCKPTYTAGATNKYLYAVDSYSAMASQTDPLAQAMAANSADSEAAGVLYMSDLLSPFAHLEKELGRPINNDSHSRELIQDSIAKLLLDVEDSLQRHSVFSDTVLKLSCREVGVQTDNDPITDAAPEYAARPPPCKKLEMIPDATIFQDIDKHAMQAPEQVRSTLRSLVNYLTESAKNELFKVRAFFTWIANHITYQWKYMDIKLSAEDVLQKGEGVCKDYCKLFGEMCKMADVRVKRIHGFAKGYDYRPGHQFHPGGDITHAWNAVFIFGAWRLIDVTWGTGYTDHTGKFQRKMNEHFFLTDPEVMIWTHFPFSEIESHYSRWQLLDKPLKLDEFNALPKVTPFFFEYNLRIRSRPQNPVIVRIHTELKIASHKPMRYKFKLYSVDDRENGIMNSHVFCQLKEDRLLGCFAITPPMEGTYYFKVYARPEWQMYQDTTLRNVAIFLLECAKAKKHINPHPVNDVPWGPTQSFFDLKLKLLNQPGPTIVTWGGKRKLTLEAPEEMLITTQVFDVNGKEIDNRTFVQKDEAELPRIAFTITPPKVGLYKMLIFGMPKPKEKGKWRLPLLASFLIDCKLSKNPTEDDIYNHNNKKDTKKKRMKVPTVR